MLKNISTLFSSTKLTIVSGIFLIMSFISFFLNINFPFEPIWVTIILSGYPLLYSAIYKLFKKKKITSALLISIAMIASILINENFAAGEIAFIMALGGILEELTLKRAKKGLSELIELIPRDVRKLIVTEDSTREVLTPVENISIDDTIRILPGESIAVDGTIISGETSIDQSIVTGESLPADKSTGDLVYSGTINRFGSIDVKVTSVGENSSLQKLIKLVKDSENKKAPIERIADKWAVWLVPIALIISILTYVVTYIIGIPIDESLKRAVTVLVVFCPCALALATPTSIVAAVGQASKNGIIIKSGEALEKMSYIDTIAFDKTGTITHGKLSLSDIVIFNEENNNKKITENEILKIVASTEAKSEHPLAKAIVSDARKKGIELLETNDFKIHMGKGIEAKIDGMNVLCGNERYILNNNIKILENAHFHLEKFYNQGKAVVLVALNGNLSAIISLSDVIRESSASTIKKIENLNMESLLLTGDNTNSAKYVSNKVGIKNVSAELLPDEKVKKIRELQAIGKKVCMIGDGINDAPAMKISDVGIAFGDIGSDITLDASEINIMNGDISKLPYLKLLSKKTVETIKFGIAASLIINLAGIIMSIFGLLNPITAALVHNAGSVLVVANATLLYDYKVKY